MIALILTAGQPYDLVKYWIKVI